MLLARSSSRDSVDLLLQGQPLPDSRPPGAIRIESRQASPLRGRRLSSHPLTEAPMLPTRLALRHASPPFFDHASCHQVIEAGAVRVKFDHGPPLRRRRLDRSTGPDGGQHEGPICRRKGLDRRARHT